MNFDFYRASASIFFIMNVFLIYKNMKNTRVTIARGSIFTKEVLRDKKVYIPLYIFGTFIALVLGYLTYRLIGNFFLTEGFRNEYGIGFRQLINLKTMDKIILNSSPEEREWILFMVDKLKEVRLLLIYNVLIISYLILLTSSWKASIEVGGIRFNNSFTPWEEIKGYYFNDDREIVFVDKKGFVIYIIKVDEEDSKKLDIFLKEYLVKRK